MTTTESQLCAMTPRSCVMRMEEEPISAWRSLRRDRICACTVTSRAVVGSSAMMSSGWQARAMAMTTRWRMPPESWWGNSSTRCSGAGMRTRCRSWMAASRASLAFIPRWSIRDSPICLPMLCTGLSAVIGSWKMTPMWRPRMPCMSVSFAWTRSRPLNRICPSRIFPMGWGSRRTMDMAVTLLPQPDSPTMPTQVPLGTVKLTPSTAFSRPDSVSNPVTRFLISNRGSLICYFSVAEGSSGPPFSGMTGTDGSLPPPSLLSRLSMESI